MLKKSVDSPLVGVKPIVLKNEHGFDFRLGRCVLPDTRPGVGFFGKHTPVIIEIIGKGPIKVGEVIDGYDDFGNEVFLACFRSEKIIYHSKSAAEGYVKLSGILNK